MGKRFTIVDVFAEHRYAGNQLAVVEADGTESAADLQSIAQEFGFSETLFLLPPLPDRDEARLEVAVRIFTPAEELPFAGHPTLGAAWVLCNEPHAAGRYGKGASARTSAGGFVLLERAGPIATWFDGEGPDATVWMQQNPPVFGTTYDRAAAAASLTLATEDVHPDLPVQQVSTGIPFVIVPVVSLDAVRRARPDATALPELFGSEQPIPIFLFTLSAEEARHDLRARMFAPQYGIAEDPATGSANGCLAGYLVRHRVLGDLPLSVSVEQGYEMGRPSLLHLRAERDDTGADAGITVQVGGRVQLVATGELV